MEKNQIQPKLKLKTAFSAISILITIVFLLFVGLIYFVSPESETKMGRLVSKFTYPAAVIDSTNFIYSSVLSENLTAIRKFYEGQDFSKLGIRVDFSTEDGKKRLMIKEKEILNKAIEDKAIEILAKRQGIIITKEELDLVVSAKLEEYGMQDKATDNLQQMYGWDLEQFKARVVKPSLYSEKLQAKISSELAEDRSGKELIEKAMKEISEGKDFTEVARNYSQGASSDEGGDFGWIAKEQLIDEIAEKIFSPDYSKSKLDIIESRLGYHIVRIEESKKEDGVEMVRLKQVFGKKTTFGDWLGERLKEMNVNVLLKNYYWNNESATVEFKKEDMKNFEKKMFENLDGDVSVIF